jgi:hypothetical protein
MKKIIKIVLILLAVAFIAIQFYRPDRTNPPIVQAETLEATTEVPQDVQAILKRSCNDCHSNNSSYPWYSNIAPISWQIVDHINEGRDELNFSKWGTYNQKRKDHKLDEICKQVESGEMPHNQYLWIHWDAKLSENDIQVLCNWTKNEKLKPRSTDENN